MKTFLFLLFCIFLPSTALAQPEGMRLVWHDEFEGTGKPDSTKWKYETGYMRNHEAQWYNGDKNCFLDGEGHLVIEARRHEGEPRYTSGSMQSRFTYRYGHVEVRAQLCTKTGAWPAIWQVGTKWGWPEGGEIDIMEYYPAKGVPSILANWCWGTERQYKAHWNSKVIPLSHWTETDPEWASKWHVWTLDWTPDSLCIKLDGEILNQGATEQCINPRGGRNPFSGEHSPKNLVWLNLALGGDNGGPIDDSAFPMQYKVDYVRIYQ